MNTINADPKVDGQAGIMIPVYEALAKDIKGLGVDIVFGLISDDICQLVATLDSIGVRFCGARHETNAIMMAEGYAAASGRLGIAAIGRGPAAANGMHGAMSASRSGSPVVIIMGEPPHRDSNSNMGGPDLKAYAAPEVFTAAGIRTFMPTSASDARVAFADAVAAAMRGCTVTLHLPTDIQAAQIKVADREVQSTPNVASAKINTRAASIDAAVAILENHRKPLIVAGIGAYRAGAREALEQLAEKTGALLLTSLKGKDMFRGHPYDMGILGSSSHSLARRYIDQADCVIAFGASMNYLTMVSGKSLPEVPLIHVDTVRTNIGRWWFADVGIVGDARAVAEQLTAALAERSDAEKPFHSEDIRQSLAAFDHRQDFQAAHTRWTVDPRSLALELSDLLPRQRNVVFDGGNFMAVWAYVSVPNPGHFKSTLDFGSVGLGLGTAMGIAAARPECPTVLFIGDGGLLMSMGELEAVIREDLPLVIIVMNDAAYGAEVHILQAQNLPVAKAQFADVDFAAIAAPLGYQVATVHSLDELRALAPTLAKPEGPILIDCKINSAIIAPFISEFTGG